jgi:hypothetical protein
MTRPQYESKQDLLNEREAISVIEQKFNCIAEKIPKRMKLDFALSRGKQIVAFSEVKSVNYTIEDFSRFGGYFISLEKWQSAKHLYETTGKPFVMCLNTPAGVYSAVFKDFTQQNFRMDGRKDRGDPDDYEPVVVLDTALFNPIT